MSASSAKPADALYGHEHDLFRESVRWFLELEVVPHHAEWERAGIVPRELFIRAGRAGLIGMAVPEEWGGAGVEDPRFWAILVEESGRLGVIGSTNGIGLHETTTMPYFLEYCSLEQRERWLPGIASGELITAVAMTEPGTGSDLQGIQAGAVRDGDHYVVNGSKTFITNGINAGGSSASHRSVPQTGTCSPGPSASRSRVISSSPRTRPRLARRRSTSACSRS